MGKFVVSMTCKVFYKIGHRAHFDIKRVSKDKLGKVILIAFAGQDRTMKLFSKKLQMG